MNVENSIDILRKATNNQELELGMSVLDKIDEWREMEEAISFLQEQRSEQSSASATYLLAHVKARYKKWEESYKFFLNAGDAGINSAYYRAAQILRDHQIEVGSLANANAISLFSKAAKNGHIWSQMVILKNGSDASVLARLNWWLHRMVLSPVKLLRSVILKSRRDDIRY